MTDALSTVLILLPVTISQGYGPTQDYHYPEEEYFEYDPDTYNDDSTQDSPIDCSKICEGIHEDSVLKGNVLYLSDPECNCELKSVDQFSYVSGGSHVNPDEHVPLKTIEVSGFSENSTMVINYTPADHTPTVRSKNVKIICVRK